MAPLDETGDLQPVSEEFFHPGFEALRAEIIAETTAKVAARAIAQHRGLLQLQTERRFGTETAERLGSLLATIDGLDRLLEVAVWIIDCEHGHDLLEQVQPLGPSAKPT